MQSCCCCFITTFPSCLLPGRVLNEKQPIVATFLTPLERESSGFKPGSRILFCLFKRRIVFVEFVADLANLAEDVFAWLDRFHLLFLFLLSRIVLQAKAYGDIFSSIKLRLFQA